jgi:predicted flap endonuclease-1-like 5' DNA nuclease
MTPKPQSFKVQVDSPEVGYLNARDKPEGALVTRVKHDGIVTVLEPEATGRAKVGQQGVWLHIHFDQDSGAAQPGEGYVAAWYLKLPPMAGEKVDSAAQPTLKIWVYSPEVGYLNIRNAPTIRGTLITQVQHNDCLQALESEATVRVKCGKRGEWLKIRLPDGRDAYAAASYLSTVSPPAPDSSLAPAEEDKIPLNPGISGTKRRVALTWNRLGGRLETLAGQLGVDPGIAVAVWAVESAGQPFGPDGRMTIRFENHIFYNQWGKNAPDVFARHFKYDADRSWTDHHWRPSAGEDWRTFHGDQEKEWKVLEFACTLDDTAAKCSISMGGPQIMGFNHAELGYGTVQKLFDAFAKSEGEQVAGFFNFVRSRGAQTIQALQNSDFTGFARIYNGPGQATTYGDLMRQAHETYQQLRSAAVSFAPPAAETPPPMFEVDDLERILGIGPKTAARLKAEGIRTFTELASLDVDQLKELLGAGRWIETWPAQARLAAWNDVKGLEKLQAHIKS